MKKFAYFTIEGKEAATSYHQAYIYRGVIEEYGVAFDYFPILPRMLWRCWQNAVRNRGVAPRLFRGIFKAFIIPVWRILQILCASLRKFDGYIVGSCLSQFHSFPWLEVFFGRIARFQRKPLFLYLPDAMHVPFPTQCNLRFRSVSHVIAVTPWLVKEVQGRGFRCFLSRVAIDIRRYPVIDRSERQNLVIGFSGGPNNFEALLSLETPLIEVLRRYPQCRLQIVSGFAPRFKSASLSFDFKPWLHDDPFSRFELGVEEMLEFDIALAPLQHSDYARGKDSAKLRQYMALGLPVVASDFGVNADVIKQGITGLLAKGESDWVESLVRLIDDVEFRVRLGQSAREHVARELDVHPQAKLLAENLLKSARELKT